jgi:peptidoglycan-associated lipoprotein
MKFMNASWIRMCVIVLVVASVTSGCRSKKKGTTSDLSDIPPITDVGGLDAGALGQTGDRFSGPEERGLYDCVYFDYDSSQIKSSESAKVEAVASALSGDANMVLVVEGHCDERGSAEYNLALGERRALAVRAYLVGLGVSADRIQTRSCGEEKPADPGVSDEAWSKNRRGEFVVIK